MESKKDKILCRLLVLTTNLGGAGVKRSTMDQKVAGSNPALGKSYYIKLSFFMNLSSESDHYNTCLMSIQQQNINKSQLN